MTNLTTMSSMMPVRLVTSMFVMLTMVVEMAMMMVIVSDTMGSITRHVTGNLAIVCTYYSHSYQCSSSFHRYT